VTSFVKSKQDYDIALSFKKECFMSEREKTQTKEE